jgi:hypothetical protein
MTSESLTLINYVEVWTLPESDEDESSGVLHLEQTFAIDHDQMRKLDMTGHNAPGEGIAGSAWKQKAPVILQGENSAVLQHVRNTSGLPIRALLAVPVYSDYSLINVVVFGLTDGHAGIEIWSRDDRDELAITGSYYEGLESFEYISQHVRFPKGAGVPGCCWKDGVPRLVSNPQAAPNFIRSFDRDAATPDLCVGLPVGRDYGFAGSVLLLLSDTLKPFARSFNLWKCKSSAPSKEESNPPIKFLSSSLDTSDFDPGWFQTVCDQVAAKRGVVLLTTESNEMPYGYRFGVVIPFFANDAIKDLAVLLF